MKSIRFAAVALVGVALFAGTPASRAENAEPDLRATLDIFYIPWSVRTRSALEPDQVRKNYQVHAELRESAAIAEIRSEIAALDCSKSPLGPVTADTRLVLDFRHGNGQLETFHTDRRFLYDEFGNTCEISEGFRSKLRFFEPDAP